MKSAIVKVVSASPYSQSKHYTEEDAPKLPKELHDAYEKRTWANRMHVNAAGLVEIPGSCFANCLKGAAKRLKLQVPGKGRVEWTKYFEAGVMVPHPLVLPIKAADVPPERLFVPSDGRRGGGKRVMKYFPLITEWSGSVTYFVFDDMITSDVFEKILTASGMLVGIGRFRPENCGYYGRFTIADIQWREEEATLASLNAAPSNPAPTKKAKAA